MKLVNKNLHGVRINLTMEIPFWTLLPCNQFCTVLIEVDASQLHTFSVR